MKKVKLLTMILLTTFSAALQGQSNLSQSLGKLVSHTWDGRKLEIATSNGKVRIMPYSDNIVRVTAVHTEFDADFSFSVVLEPSVTNVNFTENRGFFELKTKALRIIVTHNPVRISFFDADGTLLNEDDQAFGIAWQGSQVANYKTLQPNEKFFGLGAKTGGLNRAGSAFVHWNTDNPHYEKYSDPLYSSIPFYMGLVGKEVYGIFFDNTYRSQFNFGASNDRFSYFMADDGALDYYFIHDKGVAEVVQHYGSLTGKMPMPPVWSLGYQQCRWSYTPDTDVLSVARTLRERQIPADVMYLDIDFMDAYKIFTWHPENFSNPQNLLNELKAMNFHTTVIVDPGIKVEKGYHAYEDGLKKNIFAMYPDGSPYTAQVWPGWCHFPDFTTATGREWWGQHFDGYVKLGVEGFWNDMNEIATWGQQVPSLVEFGWEGKKTTYLQAKNIYGMLMARATYEGTKKLMDGKRPFSLTRAGFAGLQRYTAIWTGDNQAHDEHMLLGVRLVNTLGLSGIAFAGYDVGGFGGDATPALYSRWISIGAFAPFYRGHTSKNTQRSEPWSYGEEPEAIAKKFIGFRYNLMPYIYSAFSLAAQSGLPVQRSLALHYYTEDKIFDPEFENQYLFGPSLLVAPVSSTQMATKVYLPEGDWYDLYNDKMMTGSQTIFHPSPLNRLPVFVKAGSIIPLQSLVQSTSEKASDLLELHVYFGNQPQEYAHYEDDGTTYSFEKGDYYTRKFSFVPQAKQLVAEKAEGNFSSAYKTIRFVLHGFPSEINSFKINGKAVDLSLNVPGYLGAFSPEFDYKATFQFETQNTSDKIILTW